MQVDPEKLKLKSPGTKRLKLRCDTLLSNYAFKFKLRRYTKTRLERAADADGVERKKLEHKVGGGAGCPYQTHVESV